MAHAAGNCSSINNEDTITGGGAVGSSSDGGDYSSSFFSGGCDDDENNGKTAAATQQAEEKQEHDDDDDDDGVANDDGNENNNNNVNNDMFEQQQQQYSEEEEEDTLIAQQISKLLQVDDDDSNSYHKKEIFDCFNQLVIIFENRITRIQQQQNQQKKKKGPSSSTLSSTTSTHDDKQVIEITIDNTITVGSIGNIVIQTIQPLLLEEDDQNKGNVVVQNTDIYEVALKVLQYCATNLKPLQQHFPHQDCIDIICEMMTKFSFEEENNINRTCVVTLSNYISRISLLHEKQQQFQRRRHYMLPKPPPPKPKPQSPQGIRKNTNTTAGGATRRRSSFTIPASISFSTNHQHNQQDDDDDDNDTPIILDEKYRSKILFCVLQAMNIHKTNYSIWKYGLLLITNIVKVSSSSTTLGSSNEEDFVVCTSMVETMKLTGGISLLYQALLQKSNQSITIQGNGSGGEVSNNKTTTNNHIELKRYSYRALRAILVMIMTTTTTSPPPPSSSSSKQQNHQSNNNSDGNYIDLIFNDQTQTRSGIDIILDTMRLCSILDVTIQMDGMELIATLSKVSTTFVDNGSGSNNSGQRRSSNNNNNNTIKEILLQKGGLDCILTNMKEHYDNVGIQAVGCRAIANIFFLPASILEQDCEIKRITTTATTNSGNAKDGGEEVETKITTISREHRLLAMNKSIKQRYGSSCIKPLLRAMRMYPTSIPVQVHATAALQFIANPFHTMSISEAGGISSIVVALQQHPNVPKIHEHGWGAIRTILNKSSSSNENTTTASSSSNNQQRMDDLFTFFNENGLVTLMESLGRYPKIARIQMNGLGCLTCASTRPANRQEEIISRKGLNIVLEALRVHGCCNSNNPTQYISEKISWHGCHVIRNVTVTRDFQKAVVVKNGIRTIIRVMECHPKSSIVQLEGAKCIRNLCLDHGNLHYVAKDGGIHILLLTSMREHPNNKLITAFACDALGHLACIRQNQVLLLAKNGLPIVINAMKRNPYHKGIQEQGCIFLVRMSKNHNALSWMKNNDVNPILVSADELLPPNSRAKPLIKGLTRQLTSQS